MLTTHEGSNDAADVLADIRSSEALLKTGALQRAIFNSANFSSIATDARGVIQIFNVGAERMLGYTAAEVVNKLSAADLHDPQEVIARAAALSIEFGTPIAPGFEALVFKASRGIEDIYELKKVRKDGSRFPAAVSVTALRDPQDAIIGYLLIGTDSTARKQAEGETIRRLNGDLERRVQERTAALRESEARYRALFDSIDEGYCVIEMIFDEQDMPVDYRFVEVNPSFEKQTGLVNAVGKRMRELAPQHEEHWFEIYGRIAVTGEAARFQNHAEQLHRWFDVYAYRFGEPKNREVAILFSDITERKAAEAKIVQLNAELHQRAAKIEEANKELESFSYSVSHDLRAPLRHIHGYVEMLRVATTGQLSAKATHYLQTITDASVEMGELIDDLLAFSRMGRSEIQRTSVDLTELVDDVIRGLEMATTGRSIVWTVAPLPRVVGDRALLKQVLSNLVGNAVKYSRPRAPATIEIGCAGEEDGRAVLFVRDNGVGFDMQYAHKLFGVFQRLHRPEEFEGTGIGLATVRRIVGRHGGRVWAEGALNHGATFYFTLERAPAA